MGIYKIKGYDFKGTKKECWKFIDKLYKGQYINSIILKESRPNQSFFNDFELININE